MEFVNFFGLAFFIVMMIPNMIYAGKHPEGFENLWKNRLVEILEQAGRVGCFAFLVLIVPGCGFGFSGKGYFVAYLMVNVILLLAYCSIWCICFNRNSMFRAIALSVIPSVMFLAGGILTSYWPLIMSAVVFAPCHITISIKNFTAEASCH